MKHKLTALFTSFVLALSSLTTSVPVFADTGNDVFIDETAITSDDTFFDDYQADNDIIIDEENTTNRIDFNDSNDINFDDETKDAEDAETEDTSVLPGTISRQKRLISPLTPTTLTEATLKTMLNLSDNDCASNQNAHITSPYPDGHNLASVQPAQTEGENYLYHIDDPSRGNIVATYENIGRYKDEMLDCKVTYSDFQLFSSSDKVPDTYWARKHGQANKSLNRPDQAWISIPERALETNKSGFWAVNIKQVCVEYAFYKHGTNFSTPININGSYLSWEQLQRGEKVTYLNDDDVRAYVSSPTYIIDSTADTGRAGWGQDGNGVLHAYDSRIENDWTVDANTSANPQPLPESERDYKVFAVLFPMSGTVQRFWFNFAQDSNIEEYREAASFQWPSLYSLGITPTFKITTAASNGTITASKNNLQRFTSQEVTYAGNANTKLKSLTIDGKSVDITKTTYTADGVSANLSTRKITFPNIRADHTVNVVYEPVAQTTYNITTSAANGTITASATSLAQGSSKTISYSPNTGYYLYAVKVDNQNVSTSTYANSYTFSNLNANHTISVEYRKYLTLTTSAKNGTISAGANNIKQGESKTVTYSPNAGCYLQSVKVNGQAVDASAYSSNYPINNMTKDYTVDVVFDTYKNITTSVTHGTITPSVTNIKNGESKTVTYQPDEGYHLQSVKVNGNPVNISEHPTSYTFENVQDNASIEVVYALDTFRIDTQAVNGTIDASVPSVNHGDDADIHYEGKAGYFLTAVVVDGIAQAVENYENSYSFNDIKTNHDIKVYYSQNPVKTVVNKAGQDINGRAVRIGDAVTYKIELFNAYTQDVSMTVKDAVPKNISFTSADHNGKNENGTVVWSDVTVPAGKTIVVSFTGNANKTGSLNNTAEVIFGKRPVIVTNAVEAYSIPAPVKAVTSEDGKDLAGKTIEPGVPFTYTITVENTAGETKTFEVQDVVPAGLTILSASDNGQQTGNTVAWNLDIPANTKKTVSITVQTDKKDVTFRNKATIKVDGIELTSNEITNYVLPDPVKTITQNGKDVDGISFFNGEDNKLTYTISWKNSSPEDREFTITDVLPENVKVIAIHNDGQKTDAGIVWKGTVKANSNISVSVDVELENNDITGALKNTAHVVSGDFDRKTNETTIYQADKPVKEVVDMQGNDISNKILSNNQYPYQYKITVSNPSDEAREYKITDTVPDGVTITAVSDEGKVKGQKIEWTITVPAKSSDTVTVDVMTTQQSVQKANNTAVVKGDKYSHETNTVTTYVYHPETQIFKDVLNAEGKSIDGKNVLCGDIITYEIHVKNPADIAKTGKITDILPDGTELVSSTPKASSVQGKTLVWENVAFDAEAEKTFIIQVKTLPDAESKTLHNKAMAEFDNVTEATNDTQISVQPVPVKTVKVNNEDMDGKTVAAGTVVTYGIQVTNPSEQAKEYTVTDAVSPAVEISDISHNGMFANGVITWKLKLDAGAKQELTFKASALQKNTAFDNQAKITVDDITIPTNTTHNGVPAEPVKAVLDKNNKDINGVIRNTGDTLTYTITVHNPMTIPKKAVLEDTLPASVEFVDADYNGKYENGKIVWNLDMQPDETITVTIHVKASDDSADKLLVNQAALTFDNTVKSNEVTTPILTKPVKIVKNEKGENIDEKAIATGSVLTYEIAVRNPAGTAKQFTITDTVPEQLEIVNIQNEGQKNGQEIVWTKTLNPMETITVSFTAKVVKTGAWVNTANVQADGVSLTTNGVTNGTPEQPVKIVKDKNGNTLNDKAIMKGSEIVYEITVKNPFKIAKEMDVTDNVPDGVEIVSAGQEGKVSGQTVKWHLSMKPEETKTLAINCKVKDTAASEMKNTASASMDTWTADSTTVRNFVMNNPVKRVLDASGNTVDGKLVLPGDKLTYEITVKNPSDKELTFDVEDAFDGEHLTFVSADNGGTASGNKVSFHVNLTAGQTAALRFTAEVKGTSGSIKNTAKVTANGNTKETNTVSSYIFEAPVKAVQGASQSVKPEDVITYTITVKNPSTETLPFEILDTLPNGLSITEVSDNGKQDGQKVTWNVEIPANSAKTVSVKAKVLKEATGTLENTATVSTGGRSLLSSNTVKTTIEPAAEQKQDQEQQKPAADNTANDNTAKRTDANGRPTGDGSHLGLYIVFSMAAAIFLVLYRRKLQHSR